MASSTVSVRAAASIAEVDQAAWDSLDHAPSPFLRHGFLRALEESGSIDSTHRSAVLRGPAKLDLAGGKGRRGSGWQPVYLLAEQGGKLVGGVAAFVKDHSYGEYIFDWGWANAAQRAGIRYYPKLVIAAPATPATGRRILLAPGAGPEIAKALIGAVKQVANDTECSSIHWLFCTAEEQHLLTTQGFFARDTLQFHWKNRGYGSFDDFLGELKSRKRKQLRKERAKAKAAIDRLTWVEAPTQDQLDDLDRFYRTTTENHHGRDYLRPGFFHRVAETLPDAMRMVEVIAGGKRVAGALFFETAQGLYGRYWGTDTHIDLLHFETAYYAGIDRAIEKKLPLFEAGAQGEHKLLRGFEPSATYSAHWIRHPGLSAAIEEYCGREAQAQALELSEMAKYGPYRTGDADD
jgi:predicted N-acyltransferase